MTKNPAAAKPVPERHQILMYSSETRMPRRAPLGVNGSAVAAAATVAGNSEHLQAKAAAAIPRKKASGNDEAEEADNHRKALAEFGERCQGLDPWKCAEALLYVVDGDRLVEKYALWLFPSDSERFLIDKDEFYILVRLEGKDCLDKLSLGVSRNKDGVLCHADKKEEGVDPTYGQVVRIVSIENDAEPLRNVEDAGPFLHHAKHIRECIRKQAGKCGDSFSVSSTSFRVLRTKTYLDAKDRLEQGDLGPEEWTKALQEMEDSSSYPWKLVNLVAELGQLEKLRELDGKGPNLLPREHVVDDIWLVEEQLPLNSSEFIVASRWAVQKSIRGTGSIPRAKMWEPVVVSSSSDEEIFQLMRMA